MQYFDLQDEIIMTLFPYPWSPLQNAEMLANDEFEAE